MGRLPTCLPACARLYCITLAVCVCHAHYLAPLHSSFDTFPPWAFGTKPDQRLSHVGDCARSAWRS